MLQVIGVADFRRQLKDYVEAVAASKNQIYQIGQANDALLLSPATLAKLQNRHHQNNMVKQQFDKSKLESYVTLAEGVGTKNLPLDVLLGLSAFFGLMKELISLLANPGAKENALRWKVSELAAQAVEGKELEAHPRFYRIYILIRRLFQPDNFKEFGQKENGTLIQFFIYLQALLAQESPVFKEKLPKEQDECIRSILMHFSQLAEDLISAQKLDRTVEEETETEERIFWRMQKIESWYQTYIKAD